jgi:hypothetical protein
MVRKQRSSSAPTARTAKAAFEFIDGLPENEKRKFGELLIKLLMPEIKELLGQCIDDHNKRIEEWYAKDMLPNQAAAFSKVLKPVLRELGSESVAAAYGVLKSQRDRSSKPENIRRNADLCRKHADKPKYWTLERLRGHFFPNGVPRNVTKILREKEKWLALADDLDRSNGTD